MLPTIDVTEAVEKLQRFAFSLPIKADRAAEVTAEESFERISRGAYWKNGSGNTARSFRSRRMGDAFYRVSSPSKIAVFLDKGTRPHEIRAKNVNALRFIQNGTLRFARVVHHPGTRAVNFEATEARIGQNALERRAAQAVEESAQFAGLT